MFEIKSLVAITAASLLITSMAIALSWFVNRRLRGAHYWSLGYFLLAGGVGLQLTQGWLSPLFSIAGANLLLISGIYFTYVGVSLLLGRNRRYLGTLLALLSLVVFAHFLVGFGKEGFTGRTLVVSGIIGVLSLLISYEFFRGGRVGRVLTYRINAVIYFFFGALFCLRVLVVYFVPPQATIVTDTPFSHYTYLAAILFTILIAFSYMLTLFEGYGMAIQRAADTDVQTGLLNREAVAMQADLLIKRVHALGGQVSATFFRIDLTGEVKDILQQQERITLNFAEKLFRSFKPQDLIGRLGENAFVAVTTHEEGEDLSKSAERLQQIFAADCRFITRGNCHGRLEYVVVRAMQGMHTYDDLKRRAEQKWLSQLRLGMMPQLSVEAG